MTDPLAKISDVRLVGQLLGRLTTSGLDEEVFAEPIGDVRVVDVVHDHDVRSVLLDRMGGDAVDGPQLRGRILVGVRHGEGGFVDRDHATIDVAEVE